MLNIFETTSKYILCLTEIYYEEEYFLKLNFKKGPMNRGRYMMLVRESIKTLAFFVVS